MSRANATGVMLFWLVAVVLGLSLPFPAPAMKVISEKTVTGYMVGFKSDKEKRGIYSMKQGQDSKPLSNEIGRLDGLYEMNDGTPLVTDWDSGTVFTWSEKSGMTTAASGFKGPADLCAFPYQGRPMVVVPDLVKSELADDPTGELVPREARRRLASQPEPLRLLISRRACCIYSIALSGMISIVA